MTILLKQCLLLCSFLLFSSASIAGCWFDVIGYVGKFEGDDNRSISLLNWDVNNCKKLKRYSGSQAKFKLTIKQAYWPYARDVHGTFYDDIKGQGLWVNWAGRQNGERYKATLQYKRRSGVYWKVQKSKRFSYKK